MGDGIRGDEGSIGRLGWAWRVVNSAAPFEGQGTLHDFCDIRYKASSADDERRIARFDRRSRASRSGQVLVRFGGGIIPSRAPPSARPFPDITTTKGSMALASATRAPALTRLPSFASANRARLAARPSRVPRAGGGGSFRVIEYGDGTTPEDRGRASERGPFDDGRDRFDRHDRGGRGGRGGRGAGRASAGRGRGRRDNFRDDDDDDLYDRPRGRGSLRQKGRDGRGVSSKRGFGAGRDRDDWGASIRDGGDGRGGYDDRDERFPRRERGGVRFGEVDDGYDDRHDDARGGYGHDDRDRDDWRSDRRSDFRSPARRGGYGARRGDFASVECAGQEGRIIGKGGGMIREIQERTGAHLSVRRELGVVEVEGGDVAAAEAEIRRIVEEGRRSDAGGGFPRDGFDDGRDRRRVDRFDDAEDDWDEDDDEDWILEGFEEEMEDAAAWANGGAPVGGGRYRPELLDKYVEDDFEPLVYVREPDDADEYNFFAGSRFRQLGATEGVEASLREMGIERPSHIQALTYGALSRGSGAGAAESGETPQNVLLADQAGSGKTLAYLLPLMQRLQAMEETEGRAKPGRPRLLVLCPTSELVVQVLGVVRQLARGGLRCRSLAMTGGNQGKTQTRALKEGVDVVVGTPGRVGHLVDVGKLDTRDLQAVVMDECDVLLGDSFEFAEQVRPLRAACPPTAQFVLVTATIPEDVLRQLRAFFDDSLRVVQGPGLHRPAAGLLERLVDCSGGDVVDDQSGFFRKYRALEQLLDAEAEKGEAAAKRMLLFCNKIETCRRVENILRRADGDGERLVPVPYHAALSPERRRESLDTFLVPPKKGDVPLILVCTDRASRGLDASAVKHVILFDFPRDPSEYVRRVGRTARGALGTGEVSVLVLGRQVRLAREIMRRNTRGDPVESTPQY